MVPSHGSSSEKDWIYEVDPPNHAGSDDHTAGRGRAEPGRPCDVSYRRAFAFVDAPSYLNETFSLTR